MNNVVYIKKVDNYNDIFKKDNKKCPMFLKKIVYLYKNLFNIITKKKVDDYDIWTLPIQEKYSNNKINNILKKLPNNKKYLLSSNLESTQIQKKMNAYQIEYFNGINLKKSLIIKMLDYINKIQNSNLTNTDVTILVNEDSETNIFLIKEISKLVKSIKVVSLNIYKFKKMEEELYNEFGIAIQFSNSYQKSLLKSKIIVNFDFNNIDINEYEIFNKAIIINCIENNLKIRTKLFEGIIINSCNFKFNKEIQREIKKINIYGKYDTLLLYESIINNKKKPSELLKKIDEDKLSISNLIGNNGTINKKEIKSKIKA